MKMTDKFDTRVIQVTNVAPSCSNEQLRTLFSFLGKVKDIKIYPPEHTEGTVARVGYLEFDDPVTTGVSLHLSGTVFIDRSLMIVPVMDGKIPDENVALQLTPQAVSGMLPGQPTWPASVVSSISGSAPNQMITTHDPRLTALGLPPYPPLPATTETSKIEEIRRTVYLTDLDAKVTPELLLSFFCQVGEIKYIRMAGSSTATTRAAYIEFTDQRCVAQALKYNNVNFHGSPMKLHHSKANIIKIPKTDDSDEEMDDTMKKVKEASKLISAAADKDTSKSPSRKRTRSRSKGRSRSHSRSKRSRSRSRGRRRKSRSRSRRRSRSRHRSPKRSRTPPRRRRSRSRGKVLPSAPPVRRSRSRDRRRSRTRSPLRRRRSRTRSRSRRKSRTPPRSYSKRSDSRRKSRSRSRRRSRDRKKEEKKERKKSASLSPPALERDGSVPPKETEAKESSPAKGDSSANADGENGKAITKKRSPSPVKSRRKDRSPSPRKRSRSKSPSRRKKRRKSRSLSPRKRSRSRSGSRHRNKRDRKRSRSRDRKHDSKRKSVRDKDDRRKEKESSSNKQIKRDYDEEEKGFGSGSEKEPEREEREASEARSDSPPTLEAVDKDSDHQAVDMDMSD